MRLAAIFQRTAALFAHHALASPKAWAIGSFLILYLCAIQYCRLYFYRDPTSYFFDESRAYEPLYSTTRRAQALDYISSFANYTSPSPSSPPELCLGVATVSRPQEQYIHATLGSLLHGLTPPQRASIHLITFIAHTDPTTHPVYSESWLPALSDTLLTYSAVNASTLSALSAWESTHDYKPKALFDYAYLLSACAATGAPHIAMLEGDVLAVDGWLPRAQAAIAHVEAHTPADPAVQDWLYIRLFYTEQYLGWNSEEWPTYLRWSLLALVLTTTTLFALRYASSTLLLPPRHQSPLLLLLLLPTPLTTLLASLTLTPACLTLYFLAGRISMQPPPPGVHRMDNFGCCSQGFIFASRLAPLLTDRIQHHSMEFIDMLMEATATEGYARWAVVPSLLQHVGRRSAKGDEYADWRAKMIWNFGFELYERAVGGGVTGGG